MSFSPRRAGFLRSLPTSGVQYSKRCYARRVLHAYVRCELSIEPEQLDAGDRNRVSKKSGEIPYRA